MVAPGLCFGGCKGISLGNVAPVREQITDEWVPGVQCLPSGFAGLDLEDWWICGFLETKFHMFLRAGGAPGPSFVYYRRPRARCCRVVGAGLRVAIVVKLKFSVRSADAQYAEYWSRGRST